MYPARIRKIGWAMVLLVCISAYLALHLRVNAVKSEVRLAERHIIALQDEKFLLETEFQTRANQRQLAAWNNVEFGYKAPTASQFLEGERQLAAFGTPRAKGAPAPIRVARAPDMLSDDSSFPAMVSPLSGRAFAAAAKSARAEPLANAQDLPVRLAQNAVRIALGEATALGDSASLDEVAVFGKVRETAE